MVISRIGQKLDGIIAQHRWAISAQVPFSASANNNLPLIWGSQDAVLCGQIFVPQ
jgi:hypothetical protein